MTDMRKYNGGAREGAGRPKIGVKRSVGITLPQSEWDKIDVELRDGLKLAKYFTDAHYDYQKNMTSGRKNNDDMELHNRKWLRTWV